MGHGANRTGAGIFDDIDRFFDHMVEPGAAAEASPRFGEIIEAVDILSHSPLIGERSKAATAS